MELVIWPILLILGLVLGFIWSRSFGLPGFRWVMRRMHSRSMKDRPPKGTRPQVDITMDGVTYDLTDDLVRVADNERGWATWVVVGPQHLRLPRNMNPFVAITMPVPRMTEVSFAMIAIDSDWCRFMTMEEIIEDNPKPWPPV